MFCNQCEQTAQGTGCTKMGVCGKNEPLADIEDVLIHALCGMSLFANAARQQEIVDQELDRFTMKAVFSTLTNVNFDPERFAVLINKTVEFREEIKKQVLAAGGNVDFTHPA
ncbi:MAG: hydroxylamine reductase, partial [Candidatus Electrothrix sp. AR3]|nr:hydroxylamine reductase [Candidatus Electrothrix sp. AR3]